MTSTCWQRWKRDKERRTAWRSRRERTQGVEGESEGLCQRETRSGRDAERWRHSLAPACCVKFLSSCKAWVMQTNGRTGLHYSVHSLLTTSLPFSTSGSLLHFKFGFDVAMLCWHERKEQLCQNIEKINILLFLCVVQFLLCWCHAPSCSLFSVSSFRVSP